MFSVIIPVYNHTRYLEEAILSCLNDLAVTEILLADDGSQDASLQIIQDFARRYPHKVRDLSDHPSRNVGAHNRLNQLTRAARNEWIAVLNSDDAFVPGRFQFLKQWLRTLKTDLAFGVLPIFDDFSRRLGVKTPFLGAEYAFPVQIDLGIAARRQEWLLPLLNQNLIGTTSNMVFRKDFHERIGGFRDYRYAHDWDFALRACMMGRVSFCGQMATLYRIHPGNTIKEDVIATISEVRRLFDTFLADFPQARDADGLGLVEGAKIALAGNKYLYDADKDLLAIATTEKNQAQTKEIVARATSKVEVYASFKEIPENTRYVYAPATMTSLSANDLRNLLLSLAIAPYDFLLFEHALTDVSDVAIPNLPEFFVAKPSIAQTAAADGVYNGDGRGRLVRFPREQSSPTRAIHTLLTGPLTEQAGEIFLGGAQAALHEAMSPNICASPNILGFQNSGKPVVFVLPALIAIGGVERILIELIAHMKEHYTFIAICTERLAVSQGSWEERLVGHCEAVYNLSEILPRNLYFPALRFLKHAYQPKLIWICNGSTWQCEHALALRKLFNDAAIADHQVYDANEGWINWFDHVGVRASDCFFAVTHRILEAFITKYTLPKDKIVLVDHPISVERIDQARTLLNPRQEREKYQVKEKIPVFGFVGRLADQKQPLKFLELCAQAQAAGVKAQFLLIGGGPLEDACDQFIMAHGLANVRRLGFVQNILEVYSFLDGLVITSAYEGVPVALLEALAMGIPVFSSDVGDIRLVVETYNVGVVVDDHSSDAQVRSAFLAWIRANASYKKAAAKASAKVRERYSIETVSKHYLRAFDKLVYGSMLPNTKKASSIVPKIRKFIDRFNG